MKKVVLLAFVLVLLSTAAVVGFIRPAVAQGTIYIRADGSVEGTDKIQRIGDVYTFTDNIYDSIVVEKDNIVVDGAGYTLQGTGTGTGVYLSGRSKVTIKNVEIKAFGWGIRLVSPSSDNIISGNNITNNEWSAISLEESSNNNTISGNNIATINYYAVDLYKSSHNCISGNNVTANGVLGIRLYESSNNNITGNNVISNEYGIHLWSYSNNNSICGNNITNNGKGISLESVHNNTFFGNNMINNDYGIWLWESSDNKFYHNNFIDNTQQVHDYSWDEPGLDPSINVWDDGYPSGGNYWSNYSGVDANADGIGDTPYVIDENNRDGYPLMSPWPPPEHELVASITAPSSLRLGGSSSLNATVTNEGLNDEVDVELSLLINGTVVDSATISLLQAGNSYTLTYLWTPTVEVTYNVTAFAHPVLGETSVENNQMSKFVTVSAAPTPPEVQVGIEAGDWIKCDYTVTGWPSGTPRPEWLKVEILSVEGTTATVRVTMHMSDGTEQSDTLSVDVVAGGGTFDTLFGFVIPANCTTGDSIIMGGDGFTFNVTIDGETTRSYAGAKRTVVYASFSQYGSQLTYYWDKETGVMVEASVTSGGITGTAKVTETNMWEAVPSPFWMQWWLWTIVAVVIVAVVGAVYFLKKRKPPTPTAPTLPTQKTNSLEQ